MKLLATARFADTVVRLSQLNRGNPDGLPEVAFVGRSNAGKSSCINLVCNRRRLAFSSRTPGRTQALNLFAVGPDGEGVQPTGFLVDSPGYGFATASPEAKRSWQTLAGEYLRSRVPLAGVVLMIDIRRELTDLDRQLLSWTPTVLPLIVVITKADKLGRNVAREALRRVARDPALAGREGPVLLHLFSTLNRTGADLLPLAVESLLVSTAADWAALAARADPASPLLLAPFSPAAPTDNGSQHP